MTELDDHELLAEYARTESEAAFAALVARYVNLVYSAALRFTGNPHHAEEITQAVFIILARKAGGLRRGTVLSGWLYQTARLTAANFVKGEIRRQRREQEAYMQSTLTEPERRPGNRSRRCWMRRWAGWAKPTATPWCCVFLKTRPRRKSARR